MKRNWRRTLGQHLRRMSLVQLRASLLRIRMRGPIRSITIDQPEVRKLTGGPDGTAINKYVVGKLTEALKARLRLPAARPFDPTEQAD